MLISPPFLTTRANDQLDSDWVEQAMPGGIPGEGGYPVSYNLGWHGGIHLEAPPGATGRLPVRAIADGTVIYARQPTKRPNPVPQDHPLNYRGGWTSNGCVVIRHETEIGADANGQATAVTYYSITMHLHSIQSAVRPGRAIYRKDEIGQAGYIYGEPNKIHFEIICDDANLQRLVGRNSGDLNIGADGRVNAIYGEMYFRLNNVPVYSQRPGATITAPAAQPVTTLNALYVGLRYAGGEGAAGDRGDAYLSTYRENGTIIGTPLNENEAEYNLYTNATTISTAYATANAQPQAVQTPVPAPSAVYELLRFGRVIGPDALNPATTPHWRRIRYEGGEGWVNLNTPGINKFSDADFPHWRGWKLIDDSADLDSRCDSATIKGWLDQDQDGKVDPNEAVSLLPESAIQAKMKRTICKLPTEWEKATVDHRWGWLKEDTDENPAPLSDEDFLRLREHIEELAFWEDANIGISSNHWHFHPREFIKHWRKAIWLRNSDLSRIYTTTPNDVRERYRLAINQVLRRYGMNKPLRASHFFGQGLVETMGLQLMVEGSVSFARNPGHASFQPEANGYYADPLDLYGYFHNYERAGNDLGNVERANLRNRQGEALAVVIGRDARNRPVVTTPTVVQIDANQSRVGDGMKFRGRGFKQMTGRSNYAQYWVFRGWLRAGIDFDDNWWLAPRRPTDAPRRPAPIADPQRISIVPFNCIDSGGQFASRNNISRQADGGITRRDSDNVSRIVNRWDEPSFPRRFDGSKDAYEILGP